MIPKEELAVLLQRRLINKFKEVLGELEDMRDDDREVLLKVSTWLIESETVTETTMFQDKALT